MQETNVTFPVNTFECFTRLARLDYPSILSEIIQWNDDRRSSTSVARIPCFDYSRKLDRTSRLKITMVRSWRIVIIVSDASIISRKVRVVHGKERTSFSFNSLRVFSSFIKRESLSVSNGRSYLCFHRVAALKYYSLVASWTESSPKSSLKRWTTR